MYRFKSEKQNVEIILRQHGVKVTKKNINDSLARLIIEHYPQYAHNIEQVDDKGRVETPFTITVPELEKKKDSLLTFQNQKIDLPHSHSEKQESESKESKRKKGNKKGN